MVIKIIQVSGIQFHNISSVYLIFKKKIRNSQLTCVYCVNLGHSIPNYKGSWKVEVFWMRRYPEKIWKKVGENSYWNTTNNLHVRTINGLQILENMKKLLWHQLISLNFLLKTETPLLKDWTFNNSPIIQSLGIWKFKCINFCALIFIFYL